MNLGERKYKRYSTIGYCIYCGVSANEKKLGDEHIFPLALCGNLVFLDASCRCCAEHINKNFEGPLLRKTFGILRSRLKTWTRHPKERINTFVCEFVDDCGKSIQVTLPVSEYPLFIMPYTRDPPALLQGKSGSPMPPLSQVRFREITPGALPKLKGGKFFQIWVVGQLQLEMAKIAHGYAVAEGRMSGFDALLPPLILGQDPYISDYVGGTEMTAKEFSERFKTGSNFNEIRLMTLFFKDEEFLIALVQIFAILDAPVFQVVIGRRRISASAYTG